MVLLVSYLEYTYQNDCLSKMNVRKKRNGGVGFLYKSVLGLYY